MASNSTGRIGATVRTWTNMPDFIAVADDWGLSGHGRWRETTSRDKRKNGRQKLVLLRSQREGRRAWQMSGPLYVRADEPPA